MMNYRIIKKVKFFSSYNVLQFLKVDDIRGNLS